MSVATPSDVETSLLRPLATMESDYVQALLDRVESILLTRIPDLVTRASDDVYFSARVSTVEGEAVARVFRNPTGMNQESDGSYSYSINSLVASGLLDVLDDEWERLGVGQIRSTYGAMDGYARRRLRGLGADQWFQYGWPVDCSPFDTGL